MSFSYYRPFSAHAYNYMNNQLISYSLQINLIMFIEFYYKFFWIFLLHVFLIFYAWYSLFTIFLLKFNFILIWYLILYILT